MTDDPIVQLADEDNENDGYHHHVPIAEQAQTELTQDMLGKYRGSTVGIKPTVKHVREQAAA